VILIPGLFTADRPSATLTTGGWAETNGIVCGKEIIMSESTSGHAITTLGFIGLGVMGEPMCGHLARRSGIPVMAFDLRPEPQQRLAADGVKAATLQQIAAACDIILLSLPDGKAVAAVIDQLEPHLRAGQCVVDTSTSSVALTREIGARLTEKGILYADAPVARTREAASRGELSIMVGATPETFARIRPILETMGTDVTHCGPVGCGQVVKILNNMLVFQHCGALAEAIAIGRRNGVPADVLLPTMAMGSGDSFVLRNHGMKSMLQETFPERAFSTRYAIKDLSYALEMAQASGLDMAAAKLTMVRLKQTEQAGYGDQYHPVVLKVIDPQ
jgi:3-hydroxyisobutyrate dehydrogenase